MRHLTLHGKRRIAAIGVVASLLLTGAAIAYFTTSGSGTGTAGVGTSSALTIHAAVTGTPTPGGTQASVSFTVDNPSQGHQQLGTVHLSSINACPSGDSWTGSSCSNAGTELSSCESVETGSSDTNTANFWMPDVASNQDFGPGSGQSVSAGATLTMNDLNSSQNSCKSASLTLNFTS